MCTHRRTVAVIALLAGCFAATVRTAVSKEQPQTGVAVADVGAVVEGVVLEGGAATPIQGATVLLSGRSLPRGTRATSDSSGRFRFEGVASGTYQLSAARNGFLGGSYGRNVPQVTATPVPSRQIVIRENSAVSGAVIYLWRPASISGTVSDQFAKPVIGAYIRLLQRVIVSGELRLASGSATTTDDQGHFRLGGLGKGEYLVAMTSLRVAPDSRGSLTLDDQANARAGALVYYPESRTSSGAIPIDLDFGSERIGVDFRIVPTTRNRISGRLIAPGSAMPWLVVRLLPEGDQSLCVGGEAATALPRPDGGFEFTNVPPGHYVIRASTELCELSIPGRAELPLPAKFTSGNGAAQLDGLRIGFNTQQQVAVDAAGSRVRTQPDGVYWGETTADVDERGRNELSGISVSVRRGVRLSGKIVSGDGSDVNGTLSAEPIDGDPSFGRPSTSIRGVGDFTLEGLLPTRYVLRFRSNSALLLKSIGFAGTEVAERTFDGTGEDISQVVLTIGRAAQVAGNVRDADGKRSNEAVVVYFPTEPSEWRRFGFTSSRIGRVLTDSTGMYQIVAIPAGDYYLAAIKTDDSSIGGWQDPSFLERLVGRAVKIRVNWGSSHAQDLRVVSLGR